MCDCCMTKVWRSFCSSMKPIYCTILVVSGMSMTNVWRKSVTYSINIICHTNSQFGVMFVHILLSDIIIFVHILCWNFVIPSSYYIRNHHNRAVKWHSLATTYTCMSVGRNVSCQTSKCIGPRTCMSSPSICETDILSKILTTFQHTDHISEHLKCTSLHICISDPSICEAEMLCSLFTNF